MHLFPLTFQTRVREVKICAAALGAHQGSEILHLPPGTLRRNVYEMDNSLKRATH